MRKSHEIQAQLDELKARVSAIIKLADEEKRELTSEEKEEVDEALGEKEDGSDGKIEQLKKAVVDAQKIERLTREQLITSQDRQRIDYMRANDPLAQTQRIPAVARGPKPKHFATHEEAYAAGQFFLASVWDRPSAKQWCADQGIYNAMRSDENDKGGFLVPQPLAATIVELREQFGVFRRFAQNWPMSSATDSIPKLAGEVTAYFVAQLDEITESDASLSQVQLQAKDLYTLTAVSNQVNADAVVTVADMLSRSIAQSMAEKEDQCGFNGDGTSTYGHIQGLAAVLAAGSKHTASGQANFGALTLGSFESVKGKVKRYAGMQPAWFISSTGYYASMDRLMNAAGGNTNVNIAAGSTMNFLGDPVVFAQVLPDSTGTLTGSIGCYYGDLRMAAVLGDRQGITIEADRSIYFKKNAIAIKSGQRFDINVHETGTATESGAIVGLVFG